MLDYSPNVTTYNARDCVVTVDGVIITGLGEGMITFEKDEAYFDTVVGAQGDIIRSEINNTLYTLTLSIQLTSPQKSHLMSKIGSADTFSITVENKSLNETFGGSMANIKEMPSISRGASAEDMEFVFCVFDGYVTVNDNNTATLM